MSSYSLIEYMGFDTDISDGVAKMSAAALLGDIFHLHKRIKFLLKYVHTNSKCVNLVVIPYSDSQE